MRSARCPSCAKNILVADASSEMMVVCPECGHSVATEWDTFAPDPSPATPNYDTVELELAGLLLPPRQAGELGWLGPFRILEVLGQGGMGIVFRAEDAVLNREIAIKTLLPAGAAAKSGRDRFVREAIAAARIQHEHVFAIFQIGDQRGIPFFAMPLLKGRSLHAELGRRAPLPVKEAVRIGREIALGLAAAHAQGTIHRDIKPANVWLEGDARRVRILDFGLAFIESVEPRLTRTGDVVGTPAYMAPEQARGQKVDARADLFSLGCVLYHMLVGRQPFVGDSAMAILASVSFDEPTPPVEAHPLVPPVLSEFVMKLLAKKPDDRPASAEEVATFLATLERSSTTPDVSTASFPKVTADDSHATRPPSARRSRLLVAAGVAATLALGGFAILFGSGWMNPTQTHREVGAKSATDIDRRAAEYALSVGATVRIDDKDADLDPPGRLPAEPFRLTQVHFGENSKITDDSLAIFDDCTRLTFVNVSFNKITDAGLAHFVRCKNLQFLAIANTPITDKGIAPFERCDKLVQLFVQNTKITPAKVDAIQKALPMCKIVGP